MNENNEERQSYNGRSITKIPFFSELTPEESETVERLFVKRHYAKDQVVLMEEDNCRCMYLIYSGKVRVVKQNEEGKEQIITIHRKNDFFGEMSLLDGKTSPATIIAHEDSVIGFLSKEDFENHLLPNERIRGKIIDLLCHRLRDSWAVIKILSFDGAENRVMALLQRLQDLYGVKDDRGVILTIRLTHQQIAECASLTRETVSRVLKGMQKQGLIALLDGKAILLTHDFAARLHDAAKVTIRPLGPDAALSAVKDLDERSLVFQIGMPSGTSLSR